MELVGTNPEVDTLVFNTVEVFSTIKYEPDAFKYGPS